MPLVTPMDKNKLEKIRWLFSLLVLGLLGWMIFLILKPFILSVAWATTLVLTCWPLHKRILSLMPRRPNIAALSTCLLCLVVIIGVVFPLAWTVQKETRELAQRIETILDEKDDRASLSSLLPPTILGRKTEDLLPLAKFNNQRWVDSLRGYHSELLSLFSSFAQGIFSVLFQLVICFLAMFFFLRDGRRLGRQVHTAFSNIVGPRFETLLPIMKATVLGSVYGIMVTALAQGILGLIGYYFAGAPLPFLLGCLTTLFSLIPFGTPFIYVPVCIYLILAGNAIQGILLLCWGVGVISMADNILRPLFISQNTNLPLLLSFFGVIGGLFSFGLIGVIIGPGILAVAQVLWLDWVKNAQDVS